MKKTTIFLRFTSFVLIFAVLFLAVTEVLQDKRVVLEYDVTSKVKGFYEEPDNTLDFVFVGSSQLYASIAPNVLFEEFGITSYDFAANEQPMWISYYYIKEALKHQNPKAIVLDVFTVYGETYEQEGATHINLDDLPWNLNKIMAIRASVPKENRGSFYFELVKYHDTWNTLDEHKVMSSFWNKRNVYRGYSPFVVAHDYRETAPEEVVSQTEREPMGAMAKEWLDKIVTLCQDENVDLILVKTPNGHAERQKLYLSVEDYAKEKGIPFLNMNTVFDGEAHVNILQAEKISRYVGEYLSGKYEITDKRKDPAFAQWHEDSAYFYHKKDMCVQISTEHIAEYFRTLADKEWITMFAMEKTDSVTFSEEEKEALAALGITPDYEAEGPWCYLVLLKNGVPYKEAVQVDGPYEETILLDGHEFKLMYEQKDDGNMVAGMDMDGKNYCMRHKGINVFIFDPLLDESVEYAAFDTFSGAQAIRAQ
nr:hypothetical protein [Lachnospiraceae bacterium]